MNWRRANIYEMNQWLLNLLQERRRSDCVTVDRTIFTVFFRLFITHFYSQKIPPAVALLHIYVQVVYFPACSLAC